jgi:hypothetical protein
MTFGALNQEIVGSHTEREWMDLLATWNWRCFYCAEPVQRNSPDPQHEATKDHMTPISRGGVDFIGNIVPACLRCNQLKSDSTVDEFRAQRAWVLDRKSTGNTMYAPEKNFPQGTAEQNAEILSPTPVLLPTLEIAAMWKRVVDAAAKQKTIDGDGKNWGQRRAVLKKQAEWAAERMTRTRRLEAAGQQVLPIFGDGTPRKLMETEPQTLALKGFDLEEQA